MLPLYQQEVSRCRCTGLCTSSPSCLTRAQLHSPCLRGRRYRILFVTTIHTHPENIAPMHIQRQYKPPARHSHIYLSYSTHDATTHAQYVIHTRTHTHSLVPSPLPAFAARLNAFFCAFVVHLGGLARSYLVPPCAAAMDTSTASRASTSTTTPLIVLQAAIVYTYCLSLCG